MFIIIGKISTILIIGLIMVVNAMFGISGAFVLEERYSENNAISSIALLSYVIITVTAFVNIVFYIIGL